MKKIYDKARRLTRKAGGSGTAREEGLESIRKLIESAGMSKLNSSGRGFKLLCFALENQQEPSAKLLLEKGCEVNPRNDSSDDSPLHLAAKNMDLEIIGMILSSGAIVDAQNKKGETPLHNAIQNKKMDAAELLVKRGAGINRVTSVEEYAPLHFASYHGCEQTVALLLREGANVSARGKDGLTPLLIAAQRGHGAVVKLLLEHGAKVDDQDESGQTLLKLAVDQGDLVTIENVLSYCPEISDQCNRGCLTAAVLNEEKDFKEIVDALLKYGFSVEPEDASNVEVLYCAVERGYLRIVENLLKYGADANTRYKSTFIPSSSLLHGAVLCDQEEVSELLISYGADLDSLDGIGKSPIFYAAWRGNSKIFNLLLAHGADVKGNPELLGAAVEAGCTEIVEILLSVKACEALPLEGLHGSDVTPLHLAARYGHKKVVDSLLKYGADINCKDENGHTPLHIACANYRHTHGLYIQFVETLLEHGSDINITNKHGKLPIHSFSQAGVIYQHLAYSPDDNSSDLFHDLKDRITEVFKVHIIKMKVANSYVCPQNLLLFADDLNDIYENFFWRYGRSSEAFNNQFQKEIDMLKSEKINSTSISFFDILAKDTNSLATFMRNKNVVATLKSTNFDIKYPICARVIKSNFKKGLERKELLDKLLLEANKIFPNLPCYCLENIFGYLNSEELEILIDVCKPHSVSPSSA